MPPGSLLLLLSLQEGGSVGPLRLALSQAGVTSQGEEGKPPFVCGLGFCLRGWGDQSQVGWGACSLDRPHPQAEWEGTWTEMQK